MISPAMQDFCSILDSQGKVAGQDVLVQCHGKLGEGTPGC